MPYSSFYTLLEERIASLFPEGQHTPAELYEPQQYILSLGGKRLRPMLSLIAADLFDGNLHAAMPSALAVELFHNFSLIHDDILDKAPLRRGKETVHEKWNADIAILSGDAMMVRAYEELSGSEAKHLPRLLKLFNRTALEVCEGQQEDMNYETRLRVSVSEYKEMITKKTAVLLACSLKMGAICAGANETEANHLYDCGKHLGIAFQLKDDILDVYADHNLFGKQVAGDILCNKKTFLLLKALELCDADDLQVLEYWLVKKEYQPSEKITAIKNVYDKLKVREAAEEEVRLHFESAMHHLKNVRAGKRKKEHFEEFCKELMARVK